MRFAAVIVMVVVSLLMQCSGVFATETDKTITELEATVTDLQQTITGLQATIKRKADVIQVLRYKIYHQGNYIVDQAETKKSMGTTIAAQNKKISKQATIIAKKKKSWKIFGGD
eukprot:930825_1